MTSAITLAKSMFSNCYDNHIYYTIAYNYNYSTNCSIYR